MTESTGANTKQKTFLVTGALGCIGVWTVYHLVRQGEHVLSFDISKERHRLDLLLTPDEQRQVTFVRGDLSDFEQVFKAFKEHNVTHVIHLAALQVPLCRADPLRGAQVNVVGTVSVFEAARQMRFKHVVYASSIAVYGPPEEYPPAPVKSNARFAPRTIYGVYKQANEGTARIYWEDYGISSTALRPHTVYGVGRDQGLTSDPTKAMLAAATGQAFQINFSNRVQFQLASDVALQFIEASRQPLEGALGFNLGGEAVDMRRIIALIRQTVPKAQISYSDTRLPFPESFDDSELRRHFKRIYQTQLAEGVLQTIEQFQSYQPGARLKVELP